MKKGGGVVRTQRPPPPGYAPDKSGYENNNKQYIRSQSHTASSVFLWSKERKNNIIIK